MTARKRLKGIAIISPPGGGMNSVTQAMAEGLEAERVGLPVYIIDPRGAGPGYLSPIHLALASLQLAALWLGGRISIVHLQVSERASFIRKGTLLRLAHCMGLATVLHHHGAELIPFCRDAGPLMRRWVRRTVDLANLNIVLGENFSRFLTAELGLDKAKVVVLRNATSDIGVTDQSTAAGDAGWRFLLVANLSPRKGVSEFLASIAQMVGLGHDVRATLAGAGEVSRYRHEAEELGIADRCIFTGWVDRPRIEALLKSSDALVLPSYEEGLPMVILEALSAGVPVVATPVGSIPEVLSDGVDCLLVPPGDVPRLTSAMVRIGESPALRRELSCAGRKLYEAQFDLARYIRRILSIYEQILAGGRGRPAVAVALAVDQDR